MNFTGSQPRSTHHFEMATTGQRSLSSSAVEMTVPGGRAPGGGVSSYVIFFFSFIYVIISSDINIYTYKKSSLSCKFIFIVNKSYI